MDFYELDISPLNYIIMLIVLKLTIKIHSNTILLSPVGILTFPPVSNKKDNYKIRFLFQEVKFEEQLENAHVSDNSKYLKDKSQMTYHNFLKKKCY